MKKSPKVTVITATYNLIEDGREKFFRQCVESVHNQTYKNIEHWVIDGASKDGTLDLIKEYADKGWIKYISEPDKGMCDAMNKGIKMASGEYVAILNSDDFYTPDAIELSVQALLDNNADYSYSDCDMLDRNTLEKTSTWHTGNDKIARFYFCCPFNHESMLCKKSVYKKFGYYNWEDYDTISDYDFDIKLILNDCKGVYIPKSLLQFRMDGTTNFLKTSQNKESYKKHFSYYCKRLLDLWEEMLPQQKFLKFKKLFSENQKLSLSDEVLELIQQNWFICYLVKYLAEKGLKNYPWDDLFQSISDNNDSILRKKSKKMSVLLFNFIPFLIIKHKNNKTAYKLFGVIPLFKTKEK